MKSCQNIQLSLLWMVPKAKMQKAFRIPLNKKIKRKTKLGGYCIERLQKSGADQFGYGIIKRTKVRWWYKRKLKRK